MRITVGKGADNSVVPTVRSEVPFSTILPEKPNFILSRGWEGGTHLLASTLVIHTIHTRLGPECSMGR